MMGGTVLRIVGRVRALSPVFQGGHEKTGSVQLLNRLRFIVDGRPEDVPVVSGNSVRGVWRRLAMADMLRLLGYRLDTDSRAGLRLYYSLFSGGVLEGAEEEAAVDLAFKRRVRRALPMVALFGMAWRSVMWQGSLYVGHLLPLCRELAKAGVVPGDPSALPSHYELVTTTFQTRRDELGAAPQEGGEEPVQMIVDYEAFASGTLFHHEVALLLTGDGEWDAVLQGALCRVLRLWRERPYIGGKAAAGFGRLSVEYDWDCREEPYLQYVDSHREEAVAVLRELEAGGGGSVEAGGGGRGRGRRGGRGEREGGGGR